MTKIYLQIKETLVGSLEDYFCENDLCNWGVSKDNDADIPELFGFFDSNHFHQRIERSSVKCRISL